MPATLLLLLLGVFADARPFTNDELKAMFQLQEQRKAAYLRAGGKDPNRYFEIAPKEMDKVVKAPSASKCDESHCHTAKAAMLRANQQKIAKVASDFRKHKADFEKQQYKEAMAISNMNPASSGAPNILESAESDSVHEIQDSETMERDKGIIKELGTVDKMLSMNGKPVAAMRFGSFHRRNP